jgi:hypothetical protein
MNPRLFPRVTALLVLGALPAPAQTGKGFTPRPVESGGGASVVSPAPPAPKVVVVTYTAVCAPRQWTDDQGRTMVGRLLSFTEAREGDPTPLVVVRDGQIRFLRSGAERPVDFPLAKLSPEDQDVVRGIEQAIAKARAEAEAKAKATAEPPAAPAPPPSAP